MAEVLRRDADGVAILTLNRPEKRNALDHVAFASLRAHVEALAAAGPEVGCVVLTATGPSFCAGGDIEMMAADKDPARGLFRAETVDALAALPQPLIAAVRGHCYAGGLELVLACDFLIASETARFADLHIRRGGHPGWGLSARLPRRVGAMQAKEITVAGKVVDGHEAVRIGLASRCVADDLLEEAAAGMARAIATQDHVAAFRLKHLMDRSLEVGADEALAYERAYRRAVRKSGGWKA